MSPKTGRPPSDNPKKESLHIRVTPDDKQKILAFSKKHGYTILELIKLGISAAEKE